MSILFSFDCSRAPPYLHSFPTRRSSDLLMFWKVRPIPRRTISWVLAPAIGSPRNRIVPEVGRSEEHTSELQSRGHLVCRLLLEKKKNDTLPVRQIHRQRGMPLHAGDVNV